MLVVIPFVVNALMNFVLGLLVASILGPREFGLYAIGAALMVFVNAAAIDWLKFAAMRFYTGSGSHEVKALKWSLDVLIAGVSIALSGLLLAAVVTGIDFRLPATLVAVSVAAGICAGLFDYAGVIARAEMKDRAYALLVIVKNALALLLMVGGAWATGDATVVLAGGGLSVVGALLAMRRAMGHGGPRFADLRMGHVRRFAAYALPLVGANVMMAAMPLANRSLLASQHGLTEAGYFALASDMGIKLFGTLGATLEILLLRAVVRVDEAQGREAALRRVAANQVIVLAVALPAAVGLFCVLPPFERLFVPTAYHGHFAGYFAVMLPAFVALTVTQAAFNPVFMIAGRTLPTTLAAGAGFAVNAAVLAFASQSDAPLLFGAALAAGFATMLATTAGWALVASPERPPAHDLAWLAAALALMAAALWPLRSLSSAWIALPAMLATGAAVYAGVMLGGNVAGCRDAVRAYLSSRRSA